MTYAELNLLFLIPVAVILMYLRWLVRWQKLCWTVVALLLMTAIFDNFIVGSGIVAYNPDTLSGAFIGYAPIEDFAYTLVAAVLIPLTWWWLGSRQEKTKLTSDKGKK
ncbi:MAG: lycopene cyclase domain-containing protein [Rhodoluna sp.]